MRMEMVVVLPAPLGPRRPKHSSSCTLRVGVKWGVSKRCVLEPCMWAGGVPVGVAP